MPQLGYEMGQCNIVQGDARQLEGLLVDKCIFSPPYSNEHASGLSEKTIKEAERIHGRKYTRRSFTGGENYGLDQDNISNLPYGQIDKIVTSPPFQEPEIRRSGQDKSRENYDYGSKLKMSSEHPDNISKSAERNYGNIDSIITSPPYENQVSPSMGGAPLKPEGVKIGCDNIRQGYSESSEQIGNLKSDSYLEAMLQVYQQCHKILKPQGLMILVTKNFIREKKVVRLDEDTIKLCEQAGFSFLERHYRKLTSQSFWRIIYHQKYPGVEKIEHEDVLVFRK
ncbi:hypothetical protein ES703_116918 [subsurface metagenome]